MATNSKPYLKKNFPELLQYKTTTSRMYEKKEKDTYKDNWWFKFLLDDIKSEKFIIFAGALDYTDVNFKIFKVPSVFLLDNINKIDMTPQGWINIYVKIKELIDIRNSNNLSFSDFAIN